MTINQNLQLHVRLDRRERRQEAVLERRGLARGRGGPRSNVQGPNLDAFCCTRATRSQILVELSGGTRGRQGDVAGRQGEAGKQLGGGQGGCASGGEQGSHDYGGVEDRRPSRVTNYLVLGELGRWEGVYWAFGLFAHDTSGAVNL